MNSCYKTKTSRLYRMQQTAGVSASGFVEFLRAQRAAQIVYYLPLIHEINDRVDQITEPKRNRNKSFSSGGRLAAYPEKPVLYCYFLLTKLQLMHTCYCVARNELYARGCVYADGRKLLLNGNGHRRCSNYDITYKDKHYIHVGAENIQISRNVFPY